MLGVETHPCGPPGTDMSCSQTFFLLFQAVLSPLIAIALKISQIHERTGRRGPTVITWMEERSLTRAKECAQRGTLHSCLLSTCLCLLWLWKKKMICWLWGVGGCRWGEKNLFCLGFSQFLQCNRVFGCLWKPHCLSIPVLCHKRESALLRENQWARSSQGICASLVPGERRFWNSREGKARSQLTVSPGPLRQT